jgi:DnaK suppressor protein
LINNNNIDLQYFKKRLEERLEAIDVAKNADNEKNKPVELDQARMGRLSRMDAMQQQAMSQATAHLVDTEYRRVRIALKRMESGEYGYCMNCDGEIAEGRLRVDPSLLTCISCARASEEQ